MEWDQCLVNRILICLDAVSMIFLLEGFMGLVPYLARGFFHPRQLIHLEDSVSRTGDRNILAAVAVTALALVCSRYGLYSPDFLEEIGPGYDTLVILGVLTGWILLRYVLVLLLAPSRGGRDNYMQSARLLYDFLISGTAVLLLEVLLCVIFGLNDLTVKSILLWSGAVIYFLFIVRRFQILTNSCNQFAAFLYLCTLELVPAGAVVASGLVF